MCFASCFPSFRKTTTTKTEQAPPKLNPIEQKVNATATPTLSNIQSSPSFEERSSRKYFLANVIHTPSFRSFAQRELSLENLNFFNKLEEFRNAKRRSKEDVERIYRAYKLGEVVPRVNLTSEQLKQIKESLAATESGDEISASFFTAAEDEIVNLLFHDTYKRFLLKTTN